MLSSQVAAHALSASRAVVHCATYLSYPPYSLCRHLPARMAAYLDRPPGIPHWSRHRRRWPPCRYRCRPSTPRLPRPPWRTTIPKRKDIFPPGPPQPQSEVPLGFPPRRSVASSEEVIMARFRKLEHELRQAVDRRPSRSTDCPSLRPS
jgi:hypothetical protein